MLAISMMSPSNWNCHMLGLKLVAEAKEPAHRNRGELRRHQASQSAFGLSEAPVAAGILHLSCRKAERSK